MTSHQALQEELLRRKRKDAYLQKFVVQTDPISGGIQWSMWSQAPDNGFGLGHGVHYHDTDRNPELDVVAFIRGFGWQKAGSGDIVQGYYIQPDAISTPEILAGLKLKIEALVAATERHYYPETWITDRIYARGNC